MRRKYMAYVEGELGKRIKYLMDESNQEYSIKNYDKVIDLLTEAWDMLPNGKNEYDESYLIVWEILSVAIELKKFEVMKQWVDKIFYADPERIDSGEREMWAGRVAYELGNKDKALDYFKIANQKSRGRCFLEGDEEYKKFFRLNITAK